jgi:predicted XRE-type DNA-binding protein
MYYIKTPTQIIECLDLSNALAHIHDLGNDWLLSPTAFENAENELKEIKHKIKSQGRTNNWVAENIGISNVHLSKVLNGKCKMTKKTKQKVLALLDNS